MNNLYGYTMIKFLPTSGLKLIDSKNFDSNKYSSNSSKGYNPGHNILALFNNLADVLIHTSKTILDI